MTGPPFRNRVVTPNEAAQIIEEVKQHSVEEGQTWYLISQKWWNLFHQKLEQSGGESFMMQPVNNECLLDFVGTEGNQTFYKLREKMTESIHYTLVPEVVFKQIHERFGFADDTRDILQRKVVVGTVLKKEPFVEVYPLRLKIAKYTRKDDVRTLEVSYKYTLDQLKENAFDLLELTPDQRKNAQILVEKNENDFEPISEKLSSSLDTILHMDTVFFVDDGTKLTRSASKNIDEINGNTRRAYFGVSNERYTQGMCGLQNLGNTCFMNSALQCLSNVPELTEYFLSKKVLEEINSSNVLGTGGKLAKEYQELIKNMWSGSAPSVKPYSFKCTIGQFAPRFNGYNQQDAQELMAFLLDGLHEDLNRIYEKPYVEEKESDGRPDQIVAKEAWEGYKKRNDSIIVDLMHGQLKSTVTCNVCEKTSIKFDPFCFLSVPVPTKERPIVSVILFHDSKKWLKFNLTHTNKTRVKQVVACLKQHMNIPDSQRLVLATNFGNKLILNDDAIMPQQYSAYSSYNSGRTMIAWLCGPGPLMLVENNFAAAYPKPLSYPLVLNYETPLSTDGIIKKVGPILLKTMWREVSKVSVAVREGNFRPMQEAIKDIFYDTSQEHSRSLIHEASLKHEPTGFVSLTIAWTESEQFLPTAHIESQLHEDLSLQNQVKRFYNLEECIEMFTSREQLEENEAWYCPKCKEHRCAFKKLDVWKLPRILIVHLKRFLYTRYNRDKIDTEIVIPVKSFSPTDKLANPNHERVTYDLIAISNHMGGLGSGHYTAKAMCKTNNRWCDFNDSSASPCGDLPDPLTSREAYILVYRRREPLTPATPTRSSRRILKNSETEHMDTSC